VPLGSLGKTLLVLGVTIAAVGGLLVLADRFPGLRIGRLPGDLSVERDGFRLYFPLATSLAISVIVSLLLWLFARKG
jgi:hypothetical protein